MKWMEKAKERVLPKPSDSVFLYIIKALGKRYVDDNLAGLGGQMAYFFSISLFPFLMLVNYVIMAFDVDRYIITNYLSKILPENMIDAINTYLAHIATKENSGFFFFGIIVAIMTASKAISVIMEALQKAFRCKTKLGFVKTMISYGLVLFILFLIFISLLFLSIGTLFIQKIIQFFGLSEDWKILWNSVRWITPILGMVMVNSVLYYIISGKEVKKRYLLIGAVFSTLLWILMGFGLSYYIDNFGNYSVVYGTLGALMVMLLFLYWSGIVIVLGGELAHILAMREKNRSSFNRGI